tara:strand:+ start:283 stop:471 length:189 start_codon:yes stop_codon:yes gene_type:complete
LTKRGAKQMTAKQIRRRVEKLMAKGKASRRRGWVMTEIVAQFEKKERPKAKEYIINKWAYGG